MSLPYQTVSGRNSDGFRSRLVGIFVLLALANVLAWLWALSAFAAQPSLLATAVLAYSLGLRHALDADHIAAIDNATRKLMQEGKRPVTVGLFFALGHSAVVLAASLGVAVAANWLTDSMAAYREIGGVVGSLVSALFLFAIAAANLVVLNGVYRAFRRSRSGEPIGDDDVNKLVQQRGQLARLFRPLFGVISKSWHLFPIGFLFALGFDTASEISLFGLSAQSANPTSTLSILIFPALFAAGMMLVDTIDGVLMIGAYGWAYRDPSRKLVYNMAITGISVIVAVVIGAMQVLDLMVEHFGLRSDFWSWIAELNASFGAIGIGIVALFIACWMISVMVSRLNGEERAG